MDEHRVMCESALSVFRAGADILITYYAKELAQAMQRGETGLMMTRSEQLFARGASACMPGGVNSPGAGLPRGGGRAPVSSRGPREACVWDVDGNEYLDFVCSWGPHDPGPQPPG